MNSTPGRPRVRVGSLDGVLAVIPHVLGFTPCDCLVVVGIGPTDRITVAFRVDLPDPPGAQPAAAVAGHILSVLARQDVPVAVAVGYGPGRLVTPLADALRAAAPASTVRLHDVLRVEDGRYWSYLCTNPSCCPAEGMPFDPAAHPAARMLASAGQGVLASRDALAATIAPFTGPQAEAMAAATGRAERVGLRLVATGGTAAVDRHGLAAVRTAVQTYRDGGVITSSTRHAWLALVLQRLRVRDDAWARMDPVHHPAHQRLWADLVRRTQPGYVAPPACLLALTAWQGGDGALANLALDRALADDPDYRMALLLRDALTSGAPPSLAAPPLSPEQVADSYARPAQVKTSDTDERTDIAGSRTDSGT